METTVLPLAVAAPFILWPIEILAPYPHLLEEVFKLGIALMILRKPGSLSERLLLGASAGALFAFSESIFYLLKIFQLGQLSLFFQRLILTVPLHIVTLMMMILPASLSQGGPALKKKAFVLGGFLTSVVLHYGYNLYILKH